MMSRDMEIFARQMEQLREGNLELHPDVNGETSYSREPLCELRTYIRALEAGYMERGKQLAVYHAVRDANVKTMVDLMARDVGEKPVNMRCIDDGSVDPTYWTGFCCKCGRYVSEHSNRFCPECGQRLHWPETVPAEPQEILRFAQDDTGATADVGVGRYRPGDPVPTGGQIARATGVLDLTWEYDPTSLKYCPPAKEKAEGRCRQNAE